ncbi:ribosome small subunit-dependent GTPase A, partial [Patescibacteria group bacterium]
MNNKTEKLKLEDFGYNTFFESNRKIMELTEYSIARVVAERRGAYMVKNLSGEYLTKITGKQRFNATKREDFPAVGDWVSITELDKENATIHKILPRKTILRKKYSDKQEIQVIAANVDIAFIVESVDRDFSLNRFERYCMLVNEGGVKPTIVLNKVDLISETELKMKLNEIKNRFNDIDVISTSTITDQGLDDLANYIVSGKTYCFLGSSGVGKSSLINKLLRKDTIKIGGISGYSNRGKHTTTGRDMYFLKNGGIVIDNPGMREVGMADVSGDIGDMFEELMTLSEKCKYADCTHMHEPGCAVLEAVKDKKLDENKYSNYIKLKKETDFFELTKLEKRRGNRKFGKFVKNSLKQSKK